MAGGRCPNLTTANERIVFASLSAFSFYYVFVLSPAPSWYKYFPTFVARYSLFVLKVPLNPKL